MLKVVLVHCQNPICIIDDNGAYFRCEGFMTQRLVKHPISASIVEVMRNGDDWQGALAFRKSLHTKERLEFDLEGALRGMMMSLFMARGDQVEHDKIAANVEQAGAQGLLQAQAAAAIA